MFEVSLEYKIILVLVKMSADNYGDIIIFYSYEFTVFPRHKVELGYNTPPTFYVVFPSVNYYNWLWLFPNTI